MFNKVMPDHVPSPAADARDVRVLVIGSGFAGIGMAVRLRQRGIGDFLVLERGPDVGGTWRDNSYPGAACDVPSHLYSFSFAPNPDWSRSFSPQPEIEAYLGRITDDYGVRPHCRFDHELTDACFDESAQRWYVQTSGGTYSAQVLVTGTGALSDPAPPDLPGLESFAGTTFHSASWDHAHDLTGDRVAVIGTGASAVQLVPEIAGTARQVYVHQRTAPWVMPRRDRALTSAEKWLYEKVPVAQRLAREAIYWGRETYVLGFSVNPKFLAAAQKIALGHLHKQVTDPDLRERLTPHFTMGCKRVLLSNTWYPTLTRDDVDLVTDAISEVRPHSVVTADGTERDVDTIIFATGFHVTDLPIAERLRGRDGVRLADAWSTGVEAHKGTTVAGFPNLFLLVGPNTGLGHSSMVYIIESQVAYVVDALRAMDERGLATVEVHREVQEASNEEVQRQMAGTVWVNGGCSSWYLDAQGRNTTLWPDFSYRFRRLTRRFDIEGYRAERASASSEEALA